MAVSRTVSYGITHRDFKVKDFDSADAYASLFAGKLGLNEYSKRQVLTLKNTGSNSITFKVLLYDVLGTEYAPSSARYTDIAVAAGATKIATLTEPWDAIDVQAKSTVAGSASKIDAVLRSSSR